MSWRIFRPFDNFDLPDHTDGVGYWSKAELHGARFVADIGEDDDHCVVFQLVDGRTARLLSNDLYQDDDGDDSLLLWEGAGAVPCAYCSRPVVLTAEGWADPQATGDDLMWRFTCEGVEHFLSEHYGTVS